VKDQKRRTTPTAMLRQAQHDKAGEAEVIAIIQNNKIKASMTF
jgi:hypothetical protein